MEEESGRKKVAESMRKAFGGGESKDEKSESLWDKAKGAIGEYHSKNDYDKRGKRMAAQAEALRRRGI